MSSLLHPKSEQGHLAMLGSMFSVAPTQVDVTSSDRYQIYPAQEPPASIGEGQVLTLDIPGCASGLMYDLSRSYILCKGRFKSESIIGGSSALAIQNVAPMYGWTSMIFDRCTMSIGSQNVSEDFLDYGAAHFMHQQLARPRRDLYANEFTEGWIEDVHVASPKGGAVYGNIPNTGAVERLRHWVAGGALVDRNRAVASFKHVPLGPWSRAVLPSDAPLRVRLTRGKNASLTYGTDAALAACTFEFVSVEAHMFRIVLSPTADSVLLKHMASDPILIQHERVRMMGQNFEVGASQLQIRSALQGPKPSKVFVFTAREASLQGRPESAATFCLESYGNQILPGTVGMVATQVRLRVADQDVPLRGFDNAPGRVSGHGESTTGTRDLGQLYEALSLLSADPTDPGISSRNFSNVFVWSFDCSLAGTNALDPIVEQTQIELTMQLDQPLNYRRTVFILSYTPSVIEISSDRTIQTDM